MIKKLGGPLTVDAAFRAVREMFREAKLAEPDSDARVLVEAAAGLDATTWITEARTVLAADSQERLMAMVERRLAREPVYRILGTRAFYGRDFRLSAETLEPRPDTEIIIDSVNQLPLHGDTRFLDFGTGTGCIAITLCAENAGWHGLATDISDGAIATARENAMALGVNARLVFKAMDGLDGVEDRFSLVVSNPPYIPAGDLAGLSPEVIAHDPARALDGGEDGLDFYRQLLAHAGRLLHPGGFLVMEFGYGQSPALQDLVTQAGFGTISVLKDLNGHDRVISVANTQ